MAEERPQDRRREDESGTDRMPTADQPLNAKKRPMVMPLVLTAAFILTVVLVYLFGLEVLVPAD